MDCIDSAHGSNAINYSIMKREKDNKNGLYEIKPNENVLFLRADHLDVNNILDVPSPSDIYQQMLLRQQVAGFKRKYGFLRLEINPSKEEWKAMLGFAPVPGRLTDEQKLKILEVANKLVDDSINKLDSTDYWGYRKNKKGEKYSCITGPHTKLAESQAVWSVHFDTDDLHIHGVANLVTENNEIQETHKCKDRGFVAGDKVAEMRGWKTLDNYANQRKERIHNDGIDILKNMKEFDLNRYFAEMMARGWIVEPNSPDRNGVIHGYSIGEVMKHNDGSLSSVVMFKSSGLGHSKDLTPSHIYKTWHKLQNEQQTITPNLETRRTEQPNQQSAIVVPTRHRWDHLKRKQEEEHKADELRQGEVAECRSGQRHELSAEEKEARNAALRAIAVIDKYIHGIFNVYDHDEQADLLEGIVGQCLLNGRDSMHRNNLKYAVAELLNGMVEGVEGQLEKSTSLMNELIDQIEFSEIESSYVTNVLAAGVSHGGGGGGSTGGWGKKKDDDEEWRKWKPFFRAFRSKHKLSR